MRLKAANKLKPNMKKFLPAILIIAAANICKAQSINFKLCYQPDHNYQLTGDMKMGVTTDLSSVPQIADQLKQKGITEPVNAVMNMQMNFNINTGDAAADKTFPYQMSFAMPSMSANVNGKDMPIPVPKNSGMKMYGHVAQGGQLSIDSLNGQKVSDSIAQKTLGMMNSMLKTVNFPNHPLKVGDSFTQQIPLNLPMFTGLSNNVATTYTLVSVQGNKANFDIKQDMNMHMDIKGKVNITMTGTGTGKMTYDISNSFPITYTTDANMDIAVKADNMNVTGKMQLSGTMTYVITAK